MTEIEEFNCEICNQTFTTEKSKDSHMTTQKHLFNVKLNNLSSLSNQITQKIDLLNSKFNIDKIEIQNKKILTKLEELKQFETNKHKIIQDYILNLSLNKKSEKSIFNLKSFGCYFIASIPIYLSLGYYFLKNIKLNIN